MSLSSGRLRQFLFGISLEEATFARRRFQRCEDKAQQRLEEIGYTFIKGYHAALEDDKFEVLVPCLNKFVAEFRGFAFEGAAMGLTLLDYLLPWKKRLHAFLNGPGTAHTYMVHVGAGWTLARLRRQAERLLAQLDPVLCWLSIDGYGFHEGYFSWHRYIGEKVIPVQLSDYGRRVFDQGLGRSLWFINGADVARVSATIATFSPVRHGDLWSGVGLACAYAGGANRRDIEVLRAAAGSYHPQLAQGVAFAAKARQRAGNLADHTDLACEILCGLSSHVAANITDVALKDLPLDSGEPGYEIWRQRIQAQFAIEDRSAQASGSKYS
jgi:enediyne biosynthesis protein E3